MYLPIFRFSFPVRRSPSHFPLQVALIPFLSPSYPLLTFSYYYVRVRIHSTILQYILVKLKYLSLSIPIPILSYPSTHPSRNSPGTSIPVARVCPLSPALSFAKRGKPTHSPLPIRPQASPLRPTHTPQATARTRPFPPSLKPQNANPPKPRISHS